MAYFSTTTPEFPVIAWEVTLAAEVPVAVRYNGTDVTGSSGVGEIAVGDYWGFSTAITTGAADADSLMGVLAQEVQEILRAAPFSIAAAEVTGSYEWSTGDTIALRGRLDVNGFVMATDVEVVLPSANKNTFGSETTSAIDFDVSSVTGVGRGDWNLDGYFAPSNKTVLDDRDYQDTSFGSESVDGDSMSVVKWGTQKVSRILTFPTVYASYIYSYRRVLAAFSTPANTDVDDPNNLLQNLKDHAAETASDPTFRIFQDDGEYRTGRIVRSENIESLGAYVEDISAKGQMFSVTIPFRDLGDVAATGAI